MPTHWPGLFVLLKKSAVKFVWHSTHAGWSVLLSGIVRRKYHVSLICCTSDEASPASALLRARVSNRSAGRSFAPPCNGPKAPTSRMSRLASLKIS